MSAETANQQIQEAPPEAPERCPECKYKARHGHADYCSLIDLEAAKGWMANFRDQVARERKWAHQANGRAERWEGKFRIVKHENNQLRKKLAAAAKTEGGQPS